MERKNSNKTRIIGLRLTPDEYAKLGRQWKASTCRKLSDYIRRRLFDAPLVTTYRNRSQDDLMAGLVEVKKELNAIGNNFNQSVKKLHTLDKIPEFRNWILAHEMDKKILFNKVGEIKKYIQKILEIWLQ